MQRIFSLVPAALFAKCKQDASQVMTFDKLPNELVSLIADNLATSDLSCLRTCSWRTRRAVDHLWVRKQLWLLEAHTEVCTG